MDENSLYWIVPRHLEFRQKLLSEYGNWLEQGRPRRRYFSSAETGRVLLYPKEWNSTFLFQISQYKERTRCSLRMRGDIRWRVIRTGTSRAEGSRGTHPYDLPSNITSSARGASGSVFIVWYNPVLKTVPKLFHNQKHKRLMRYWAQHFFLTYICQSSAWQLRQPGSFIKSKNMQGSDYLLIDKDMNNVHLSFQPSILVDICHISRKSLLQATGVAQGASGVIVG